MAYPVPNPRTVNQHTALPMPERFWVKVDQPSDPNLCMNWKAGVDTNGYGRMKFRGAVRPAHRIAWTLVVGEIAPGLQLDHLCLNKLCVNPLHLEPVTQVENMRRTIQTHCKWGHPLHRLGPTRNVCRTCNLAAVRRYKARKRAAS